jgi:hypothetical protein
MGGCGVRDFGGMITGCRGECFGEYLFLFFVHSCPPQWPPAHITFVHPACFGQRPCTRFCLASEFGFPNASMHGIGVPFEHDSSDRRSLVHLGHYQ